MDQRAARRFPTEVEADCRSCDRAWTARLVNISTTGCMVACPEEGLADGTLLRLRIKGLAAIDGAVVWQHRNHAGVRFQAPLHDAVLNHLVSRRAPPIRPAARAAPGLDGQLVKRARAEPRQIEPRQASAG